MNLCISTIYVGRLVVKNKNMEIQHIGNNSLENWVLITHGEEGYLNIAAILK